MEFLQKYFSAAASFSAEALPHQLQNLRVRRPVVAVGPVAPEHETVLAESSPKLVEARPVELEIERDMPVCFLQLGKGELPSDRGEMSDAKGF